MTSAVVDLVGQCGLENEAKKPSVDLIGKKTDARQYFQDRFTEDLPEKLIFRKKLAPHKEKKTASNLILEEASKELQNTHFNSNLPPSMSVPQPIHSEQTYSTKLIRGTLHRPRNKASSSTSLGNHRENLLNRSYDPKIVQPVLSRNSTSSLRYSTPKSTFAHTYLLQQHQKQKPKVHSTKATVQRIEEEKRNKKDPTIISIEVKAPPKISSILSSNYPEIEDSK